MQTTFVLENWWETVDGSRIGASNIRESFYYSTRLKTAFDRHKSYANPKSNDVSFSAGDWVFLKVSPMKGVIRLSKKGKLASWYIGKFEIDRELMKWHTDWCYSQSCRRFTQFSTCRGWESPSRILRMYFSFRQLSSAKIWPMKSI